MGIYILEAEDIVDDFEKFLLLKMVRDITKIDVI